MVVQLLTVCEISDMMCPKINVTASGQMRAPSTHPHLIVGNLTSQM